MCVGVCIGVCSCVCVYIASHLSALTASHCVSAIAAGVGVVCVLSFTCDSSPVSVLLSVPAPLPPPCHLYLLPVAELLLLPTSWAALMKFAWVAASEQMPSSSRQAAVQADQLSIDLTVCEVTAGGNEKEKRKEGSGRGPLWLWFWQADLGYKRITYYAQRFTRPCASPIK